MLEKRKSKFHLFTGWWSVLFIGVVSGLGHGFNMYALSVFFKDIAGEFGIERAATSWSAGIGRLEGGITSPLVGWLSDKFGPRWIVILGIFIAAVGMIIMYFITQVWHYYVAWGVLIGLGLNIGLTVACDKMINDWFIKRRGLAQGIKFALIGVFGIVIIQVITWLNDIRDWRFCCLVWGLVMLASIPLAYVLIKPQRPEHYGLLPDGAEFESDTAKDEQGMIARGVSYASSLQETEYSFKQALKTSTYWLMVIGFTAHNFIAGGFNLHVFPFLTDIGIDDAAASGMMGIMIFFTIPARFFGGIIADRIPKRHLQLLLVAAFLLQVIGISAYLSSRSLAAVYVLLVCHGLSSGAMTPLIVLILGRYFGRKAFGSILGTMIAFLAPMGLFSPVYYGWIFDNNASYDIAFITAVALASIAVVATFLIRPPKLTPNGTIAPR
ncbi:MAG: MFS transporter [Dehalococcoidales bacterium]|nr:MFS transporter [Dehalococcoidales bacterium]